MFGRVTASQIASASLASFLFDDIRLHKLRGHEPHLVASRGQNPCPIMCTSARSNRLQLGKNRATSLRLSLRRSEKPALQCPDQSSPRSLPIRLPCAELTNSLSQDGSIPLGHPELPKRLYVNLRGRPLCTRKDFYSFTRASLMRLSSGGWG